MNLELKEEIIESGAKVSTMETIEYTLYVDGVPTVRYSVCLGTLYGTATVEYENLFVETENEELYTNKGYTTYGLNKVIEILFENKKACEISLDISPDNEISKKIAKKTGFIKVAERRYVLLHSNTIDLYNERIKKLILKNPEMKEFYESRLDSYPEYVLQITEIGDRNRGDK